MATTANRSYPYPVAGDPPAGHTQIQALATAVDVDMQNVDRFLSGYVTTDIPVAASVTYVNATGLSFAVAANQRYAWRAVLFYNAAAAGKLKFGYTIPVGASMIYGLVGLDTAVTAVTGTTNFTYLTAVNGILGAPTAATNVFGIAEGTLINGANAGTFQIQFAQNAASGTTTLRANSHLIGRRLT